MLKFFSINILLLFLTNSIVATDTITLSDKNYYNLDLAIKDTLKADDTISIEIILKNISSNEKWDFVCHYWSNVNIIVNDSPFQGGWNSDYKKENFIYEKVIRSPTIPIRIKANGLTKVKIILSQPILRSYNNPFSCAISKSKGSDDIFTFELSLILSFVVGLLILSIYNFLLYFITKENSFIKYSISQAFFAFIWLNSYGLSIYILGFSVNTLKFLDSFLALAYIWSYIWFSRDYLSTKINDKKLDRLFKLLQNLILLILSLYILTAFINSFYADYLGSIFVSKVIAPLSLILLIISIVRAFKRKEKLIRYFIFANLIFIFSVIISNLITLQLIPVDLAFKNIMLFGGLFEAILFSIGLAAKIKSSQKEKEIAQANLLQQLKENEMIKDEFSQGLEQQVRERTLELKDKNQKINLALKEKEAILRETHHRVKNNLQLMYSFMSLQSKRSNNIEIQNAISENKDRIKTLAMVHDKLSLSQNSEQINIKDYLPDIINQLSTLSYKGTIKTKCEIDNQTLLLKKAVYLGLIVNEILTNSLKYANFEAKPTITFNLIAKVNGNKLNLTLFDDGPTFTDSLSRKNSLGELIILDLAKQLKAEINVNKNFKYYISIPI